MPVWAGYGGNKRMLYPNAELIEAILHPHTTKHRTLLPLAARLRREWQIDPVSSPSFTVKIMP